MSCGISQAFLLTWFGSGKGRLPESIMHTLRCCEVVIAIWNKFVDESEWSRFFSLGLSQWLKANLQDDSFGTGQWNWPTHFGIVIYSIWQNRNKGVFIGGHLNTDQLIFNIGNTIEMVHLQLVNPSPLLDSARKHEANIRWFPPPSNMFKLNTDGSYLQDSGISACGGIIRDSDGRFVAGFHCNLGTATSIFSEMWSLVLGLWLARKLSLPSVIVKLDSEVIVNMIKTKKANCLFIKPLLEEA